MYVYIYMYRSLQIFIIFCMYEYVWVCMSMYEYLWVYDHCDHCEYYVSLFWYRLWESHVESQMWPSFIELIHVLVNIQMAARTSPSWHSPWTQMGHAASGSKLSRKMDGFRSTGAAFLLLVHWYPRTHPSVRTETHSFGHRPRSQEQIGRWQCAWLSFPLDAHCKWDLFNKHGYPPVS